MIKLSICVPTYNREAYLRKCLDSILLAVKGYEQLIEIIISDNASQDETREVAREYKSRSAFIHYHVNAINVYEKNYHIAASLAKGEYVWLFSDDDLMEAHAIGTVLNRINENYNLVISNYSLWSNDFTKVMRERMLPLRRNKIINDHNLLLRTAGLRLGFISMIIIKREVFLKLSLSEYEVYIEYGFSFLYAVYSGVIHRCRAYIYSQPMLLKQRGTLLNACANKEWWYKCFVSGSSLIFEELRKKGYSGSAVYRAKHLVLKDDVLPDLLFRKIKREDISSLFKLLLPYYKNQAIFWVLCVPVIFMPSVIIKIAYKLFGKHHKNIELSNG
jgi:glycosyltransferase involved in cell wall biosynthesis